MKVVMILSVGVGGENCVKDSCLLPILFILSSSLLNSLVATCQGDNVPSVDYIWWVSLQLRVSM